MAVQKPHYFSVPTLSFNKFWCAPQCLKLVAPPGHVGLIFSILIYLNFVFLVPTVPSPVARFSKPRSRKLFGPEKPFVKVPTAFFGKPIFERVFKVTKRKVTVKFDNLNPLRSWDTKGIVTPENGLSRNGPEGPFLKSPGTLRAIFGCHNSLCKSRTESIWTRAFNSSNFTVIFLFVTLKTC